MAAHGAPEGAGGIGVRANARAADDLLDNATDATIRGGRGGFGLTFRSAVGVGGAGVSSAGAIAALTNSGGIEGGNGGGGFSAEQAARGSRIPARSRP